LANEAFRSSEKVPNDRNLPFSFDNSKGFHDAPSRLI
jgi:hypothetical protein